VALRTWLYFLIAVPPVTLFSTLPTNAVTRSARIRAASAFDGYQTTITITDVDFVNKLVVCIFQT
jgi:hypothetical protein